MVVERIFAVWDAGPRYEKQRQWKSSSCSRDSDSRIGVVETGKRCKVLTGQREDGG